MEVNHLYIYIYIRPCPLPLLHLTVINGGTRESHQAMLKEFSVLPVLPGPSLSLQLRPSLPFIASFCPWSLSPLSSVPSLSLYLSLKGTLGRRSVLPLSHSSSLSLSPSRFSSLPIYPHSPLMSSSYTCVSGRLSLLSRGEFSQWAQMEGLFQLCLDCEHTYSFLTNLLWAF